MVIAISLDKNNNLWINDIIDRPYVYSGLGEQEHFVVAMRSINNFILYIRFRLDFNSKLIFEAIVSNLVLVALGYSFMMSPGIYATTIYYYYKQHVILWIGL